MHNDLSVIPFHPLSRQWNEVRDQALTAFDQAGKRSRWILGEQVSAFEAALAPLFGHTAAVGTGNGLDALELALRAIGVREGMKVLTTPLSAFATTLALLRIGALPVFVDVDECGLLDLDLAEEALRDDPELRALLPVHLYGAAINLRRLANLRDTYGLLLVEDCAQSIGAERGGLRAGSVGQASAVSFYPTKNLGAFGDAGAVVSSDGKAIEAMRSMRDYGQTSKFEHSVYGMNSRLDELHAAILADVLLPRLSEWTIRRRALARRYLAEIRHPRIRPIVKLDPEESVWHLFPVAVEGDRESFRGHLADCGIETALHYPRLITEQPFLAHQGVKTKGSLQRATRLAHQEVSLPIHPWMSDAEQNQVLEALRTWPG